MARSPAQQIFESLMVSSRLSGLERHTDGALAGIVRHAQRTVPFYRERLAGLIRPDGGIDLDAWSRVDPLRREDVQLEGHRLRSQNLAPGHGEVSERSTSGTTGKPVTIAITDRTKAAELAIMGRFYSWIGLDPKLALVILQGGRHPLLRYREMIQEPWFPDWLAGVQFGGYARMHYPATPEEQLAFLGEVGPVYFNTQPSNLRQVMNSLPAGRTGKADLRGILTLGEMVTEDDRRMAHDRFGCRIYDTYSATDVGTIASQCSHGSLHVNAEILRVDIARDDGSPCAPGEAGRILVTTLANAAMPLIRYEIGDIGALGDVCACGLSLPRLTLTVGRERRLFRFSDGSTTLPVLRMEKFAETFPVRQWQLVQTAAEAVELRFVSDASDDDLHFDTIAEQVKTALNRAVQVSFRRSFSDLTSDRGKLEPTLRLVP